MDKENGAEEDVALQAKKKFAMFVAGIITFAIFGVWIYFFINKADETVSKSKEGWGKFVSDIKEGTGDSVGEIKGAFGELGEKANLVGEFLKNQNYSEVSSTSSTTSGVMIEQ